MTQPLPGNSHLSRQIQQNDEKPAPASKTEPEKFTPIVEGTVRKKKEPLGSRIKNVFNDGDEPFHEYMVTKIIIPGLKELAVKSLKQVLGSFEQVIEEAITGKRMGGPRDYTTSPGVRHVPISYNTRYNGSNVTQLPARRTTDSTPRGPQVAAVRRSNIVEDIVVPTREAGEAVIDHLAAKIDSYGHCTVGDLYDLCQIGLRPTDELWGWTNLNGAHTASIPGTGDFILILPKCHELTNR